MFFLPFSFSGIPDLALAILKMLIGVCFRDMLQPEFYQFALGMICLSASWYSRCKVDDDYQVGPSWRHR